MLVSGDEGPETYGSRLTGGFGSELFTGGFATSRLARSLLPALVSITKNYQHGADSDPKDDTLVRAIRRIKNQSKTLRFGGESSCFECGCDVVIYVCVCNGCRKW